MSTTPYTLAQLSTMMDSLTGRVTTLDGVGLPTGTAGSVPTISAQQLGLKADVKQLTNTLQTKLNTLVSTISGYTATMRQFLGQAPTT
jgi:hypothetical protein